MALARADVGLAVIDRHLVGNQRLFLIDAQDGAMSHHAIQALIGSAGGGDDHFALALAETAVLLEHQRIVVGKEGAPLGRPASKGQKNIGNKARLLLYSAMRCLMSSGRLFRSGKG
jgi:hypothetical protein